jgi:hypothetical protein
VQCSVVAYLQAEGPHTYRKDLIWKEHDSIGSIYPYPQIGHSCCVTTRSNWARVGRIYHLH